MRQLNQAWIGICIVFAAFCPAHTQPVQPQFERIFDQKAFSGSRIRELFQDRDGFIWIGAPTGLFRYDGYALKAYVPDLTDSTTISGLNVISITQDEQGFLWFGTELTGLNKYDPASDKFTRFSFDFPTSQNYVNTIWGTYHEGHLVWVASRDGLLKLDPETRHVRRFRAFENPVTQDQVRGNMLRQIRPDPKNPDLLWFTALSGVYTFHKVTEQIQPHYSNLTVAYPLSDESDGQYMYSDFEWMGDEWILGAYGGGHYHYNPETGSWRRTRFEAINPNLPLSFNVVMKYAVLSDTVLAFTGSKAGLYYPVSGAFSLFDDAKESGNVIVHTAEGLLLDNSGFLWMGAWDGLRRSADPVTAPRLSGKRQLYFPEIRSDTERLLVSGRHQDSITLQPGQRNVQISYALIAPGMTDSVFYQYRLHGQTQWVDARQNRMASFTNLRYGHYQFEVQAMTSGNRSVLGTASLEIIAKEVFWKQTGFLLVLAAVLMILVIVLISLYQKRLRIRMEQKAEYERKLAQSEMAALRAQLNPHFLFNSLNSIKQFIIKSEPRSATRYLNKFAQLMRLALDHSKHSTIPLAAELEFLELFLELEQLRLDHKFSYTIKIDDRVDAHTTVIPPLLIQPYVENAIWHGLIHKSGNGHLSVEVNSVLSWIEIHIEDDGVGRSKSAELQGATKTRKSAGMRLGEERFRLMKQMYGDAAVIEIVDLVDSEGQPCGTRVTMKIPTITAL